MIIELVDVQEYGPDHIMSTLDVTDDAGKTVRMAHFMPKDAAEWRVAEYGLDPDDHETLIDVLLHEGHAQADLAPEDTLHHAPTVEHARNALLGAVRARKATSDAGRRLAKGKPDPEAAARQRMKGLFVIHPDVVAAKREHVEGQRAAVKAARERGTPPPSLAAQRLAAFTQPPRSADASDHDH